MVIDTSAVLAILLHEPEAPALLDAIDAAPRVVIGAPTLVEAAAVLLARKGPAAELALDGFLAQHGIVVVPFGSEAAALARVGYARFGRGSGRPAVLNLGDAFAYGLAQARGEPLLCKGDDFPLTDVEIILGH